MMNALLKRIFSAPLFEEEEKTHRAYLLNVLLWASILMPIPYCLYVIISIPQSIPRALPHVFVAEIINFTLLYLLHRGHVQAAAYGQVFSFWIFFGFIAINAAGIHSPAYLLGYPLVIVIAGILLGARASSVITILSLAVGGWILYAEKTGWFATTGINSPTTFWILTVVIFPLLLILQYLSSNILQIALLRARSSEDRYKLILSISSDYIFETTVTEDGSNTLTWVGGAFEKLTGYTFSEYVESGGWVAHIHAEDLEKDAENRAALFRNENLKSEIRTLTKNGELRWVRVSARPVWDAQKNRVTGIIGSVQDVTEIKTAQEAEREFLRHQASMVQNISDMAWLKDRESRYLAANEKFAIVSGRKLEEIIGKTDYDLWEEDFAKAYRQDDQLVLQSQKLKRVEEKQRDHLGNEYWVETIKTPIFNSAGLVIGTTGIARDITERKQSDLMQQRRRKLLEEVIALGKIVTEADDLRGTIKKIWDGIHDVLEFDRQAIFLYNFETNHMDDTFGTNNLGEMVDNWHLSFPIGKDTTFAKLLEKPDGYYLSTNYDQEDNIDESHDMYGVKHFLAVAAWSGDKPVAVICADNLISARPISDEQLEALRLFAGYAGLAIENSRLHATVQSELAQQKLAKDRERERRAILEKVVHIGKYVTEVNDLHTTLIRIWEGVHNDLGFDRVAIFLYNPAHHSTDGTFGTNNRGEMIDEWYLSFPMDSDSQGSAPFQRVLEKPNTIYLTHNYEQDYNIPAGHIMSGVKDFAAIGAWAGDKPVAFLCVDHNITQRPIRDEQIEALKLFAGYAGLAIENARLNNALQNELGQRQMFIDELEAKNAELERFTYTVSHDLKSPLVTISGFLGYLEKDAISGNIKNLQANIKRILMATEKMQRLLKDLLELSRIGRLINTPVEIRFNAIVKDAIEILQGQLNEKNLTIQYQENDMMVKGDFTRLVEVLQNLLENAIKFMGSQPHPKIEVNFLKNEKDETVFYVKDNGMGIATEYHEKIFGLFNKLEANSAGTGIGLALVKRIIEVHGGRIWVESQPGEGTTFYFTIPQ
jgi:PAS domain S-box-containing protein